MVRVGVKAGIERADALVAEAVAAVDDPSAARVPTGGATATASTATTKLSWGANIQRILLTGVSYMIPFVAGGGLLIAIGFAIGGFEVTANAGTVITTRFPRSTSNA